jgi:prepilin-type N-terminal cleavage/methylation domain-containing protein
MKKRGFTLIELLAVIAILAVLITLGSRGIRSARINARRAQAMVEMKSIETAIAAYMNKYGRLPVDFGAPNIFDLEDDSASNAFSERVVSILAGGAGEGDHNPAGMVFLEPPSDGEGGLFRDPWGCQYRILLDSDYDRRIDVGGEIVRRKVAILSVGLYHLSGAGSTNDLVKSWQ